MYNMYKILYYYYSSATSPQQFCPNKKDKSCMVQNNAKFKTERMKFHSDEILWELWKKRL